jgi:uncharacterized membrane protein
MASLKLLVVAVAAFSSACSFAGRAPAAEPAALAYRDGAPRVDRSVPAWWASVSSAPAASAAEVEVIARGTEPDWTLVVARDGMVFTGEGAPRMVFPYQPATRDGARIAYASSGGEHRVVLRVSDHPCTDPATGEIFSHTAYLRFDGRGYSGCAVPGGSRTDRLTSAGG